MIFNATAGNESLNNISVYDKITDLNMLGGRYFRILGTNKVFDVRSILTKTKTNEGAQTEGTHTVSGEEKYSRKLEILEEDILPEIWIDDEPDLMGYKKGLLDLINGRTITTDKKIRIQYEGKVVGLDTTLYNKQACSDEAAADEQQYYKTNQGTFLRKEDITPPAYKQLSEEDIIEGVASDGRSLFSGAVKEYPLVRVKDEDGRFHYYKDTSVQYKYNPETKQYDAHLTTTVEKKGEPTKKIEKTISNVGGVSSASISTSIRVKSRSINGVHDQYAIYNDDGTVRANIDIDQPASENKKIRIHHKVKGKAKNIVITNNAIAVGEFVCPLKSCNVNFQASGENHEGNLVLNLETLSNENVLFEGHRIVGLIGKNGKTLRLNSLPFGISFSGKIKNAINDKLSVYKESRIFGRDGDKSTVVADVIQTSDMTEEGEVAVFDYVERERVFREFQKNTEELKKLSLQGIHSESDLEKMQNLKKLIDEQLVKLGDYETAKEVLDKKKEWEAENSKPDDQKDQSKIDATRQAYEDAIKKSQLGYYKDAEHLATIDDVIKKYQQGDFFKTFYFDENGKRIEINSGDLTTITSNLPFDWSKSKVIDSIIGKDKVSFNKATGKAEISMSPGAKELVVGSSKLAGLALNLSFSGGPISLLFMPFGVTIATACMAVSGVTALTETIRTKVKQAKLNNMTPQSLKRQQDIELEDYMEKEFKKAYEEYLEDVKHAERNFDNEEDLENRKLDALNKLTEKRKAIYRQYMLSASANITSHFDIKEKNITNENVYGWLGWREKVKNAKHRVGYDAVTRERIEASKTERREKIKEAKSLYKGDILKKKIEQINKHYDDVKYEFLSEYGPLKKRLSYLRKTEKWYKATSEERAKMESECKENCANFEKNLVIEEVSVSGKEGYVLEAFRKKALDLAEKYMPKEKIDGKKGEIAFSDIDQLLHDDLKVPISVNAEAEHLAEPHEESEEFEQVESAVKEYSRTREKCVEALDSKERLPDIADEIYEVASETQAKMKSMFGEELSKKIMEDKVMWFDKDKKKSEERQLQDFIELLEKTYNTPESRNKYILDKYDDTLDSTVKEMINKLKEEFKEDEEVIGNLTPAKIKRCKQYIMKSHTGENPRYGIMGENEKFIKFLTKISSIKSVKAKKDALLAPFVKVEEIIEQKKQEKLTKEETQRIAFIEEAQKQVEAWYKTANDEQIKKYDSLASQIINAKLDKISLDEFKKMYKKFKDSIKETEHTV